MKNCETCPHKNEGVCCQGVRKMPETNRVIQYLQKHGFIYASDARKHDFRSLAQYIRTLREEGHHINTVTIRNNDRYMAVYALDLGVVTWL